MSKFRFVSYISQGPVKDQHLTELMQAAGQAKNTPRQSGYAVHGAALTKSGRIVKGGNHEYGLTRAIHCEEALVANALQACGPDDPIVAVAFSGENESERSVSSPCGNCRDVLKEYLDPEAVILAGPPEGGTIWVVPFAAYLNDSFCPLPPGHSHYDLSETRGVSRANEALSFACPGPDDQKGYGAALLDRRGRIYAGAYIHSIAFHPVLPLAAALTVRRLALVSRQAPLDRVIVVSRRGVPSVPYLERQHLYESLVRDRHRSGLTLMNPPVRLYHVTDSGAVLEAWETDALAWLPYPFAF